MYHKPLTRGHPPYKGKFLLVPMVFALEAIIVIDKINTSEKLETIFFFVTRKHNLDSWYDRHC